MDHRPMPRLPLLLLAAVVLVLLSCAVHAKEDCSKDEIGTNDEAQIDSENGGGCHNHNHTHSHGHHGDSDGKDKPGTTPGAASNNNNPWVLTAGAAPRAQVGSWLTAATGVIVLITGAAVSWLLTTY